MEHIVRAGGEDIRPFLTYLLGLADLLGWSRKYVEACVHEFYASLWIDLDHHYMQYTFRGSPHRLYTSTIREKLRLPASTTRLHDQCYDTSNPPRCADGGQSPGIAHMAVCFRPPFGDGYRRTPSELRPIVRLLNNVMRRTLLPWIGFKEGLTNLQQWLLAVLASQSPFDIVDFMICEMEDTIADGIRSRHHLPYAHWISFLLMIQLQQGHRGLMTEIE